MAKGQEFERTLCKKLSLWWSNGKADDWFWRTSGSGSRATMRRKNNKIKEEDFGDIKSDHPETKAFCDLFVFEAKTGYCKKKKVSSKKDGSITSKEVLWSLLDMLDSNQKESQFITFWKQVERDASIVNKIPLLIFRRPQRKPCIAMRKLTFDMIASYCPKNMDFPMITLKVDAEGILHREMVVIPLYAFFDWSQGHLNEPVKTMNKTLTRIKIKGRITRHALKSNKTC